MVEDATHPPVVAPRLLPDAPSAFLLWERLPVVLDTNVLLSDCQHVVESGKTSFLLASTRLPVAHLFATERVRSEVERHLPDHARRCGLDPEKAMQVWHDKYLAAIRFVDIDGDARDHRVVGLLARDPTDKPTGLLAELLAPCLVFSRDKDLLDTGIARREWVTLSSAAQDVAKLQAVYSGGALGTLLVGIVAWEAGSSVVAAAKAAPLPALVVGGVAIYLLRQYWTSDRGGRHRTEARELVGDAGRGLNSVWTRAEEAERLLEAAAFVPDGEPNVGAQLARVVAVAPMSLRAADVAERLDISTQKATAALRAPLFLRSLDGRYALGRNFATEQTVTEQPRGD